ncbi:hypothetical protein Lalb_Chr25g0284811 [Lupinus albus]|uniref:Uncharacterized protein n=1 Tax=Lupinus albus TaxID=3870 RepID=A0A6A4MVB1_LUPAL|nr:hypothetical protein Lalb_Chr25g0284811 [Lupinus albus]
MSQIMGPITSLCSLLFSLGIIWAVRYKTEVEIQMEKMLKREKEDCNIIFLGFYFHDTSAITCSVISKQTL